MSDRTPLLLGGIAVITVTAYPTAHTTAYTLRIRSHVYHCVYKGVSSTLRIPLRIHYVYIDCLCHCVYMTSHMTSASFLRKNCAPTVRPNPSPDCARVNAVIVCV